MITCEICKKLKNESEFSEIRYGGLSICRDCIETEEAKKLKAQIEEIAEKEWQRRIEYEEKKRKNIKNQIYEGQYDWM